MPVHWHGKRTNQGVLLKLWCEEITGKPCSRAATRWSIDVSRARVPRLFRDYTDTKRAWLWREHNALHDTSALDLEHPLSYYTARIEIFALAQDRWPASGRPPHRSDDWLFRLKTGTVKVDFRVFTYIKGGRKRRAASVHFSPRVVNNQAENNEDRLLRSRAHRRRSGRRRAPVLLPGPVELQRLLPQQPAAARSAAGPRRGAPVLRHPNGDARHIDHHRHVDHHVHLYDLHCCAHCLRCGW